MSEQTGENPPTTPRPTTSREPSSPAEVRTVSLMDALFGAVERAKSDRRR